MVWIEEMPREANSGTTREKLLTQAVKLFLKKGYDKTSTRDLAKAVGIKAPGIYYHFKSKKEILDELNEESWRRFREMVLEPARAASDPEERVRLYIRNMIRYQLELGEKTLLIDDSVTVRKVGSRKSYEREVFNFLRDSLKELSESRGMKNPINANIGAFALFAMVARVYQWYKPKGAISLEDLSDQMIRLFLEGFLGARK
jgi:TetR/AcrR family transcriptional regulator, cholesterol catabolism regulator